MLLTMKISFAKISVRMTRTNQYNSLVPKIECFYHCRFLWIKRYICIFSRFVFLSSTQIILNTNFL